MMMTSCSKKFGKIFLIVINSLFAIFGLMLILPGVVMLANVEYINEKVVPLLRNLSVGGFSVTDLADDLAIVMVVAGSIVLFIAILGMCGACRDKKVCLCVYGIIVLTLLVAKITVVVLWIVLNAEVQKYIKDQMYSQLLNTYTYDDVSSDQVSTAWNYMFMGLECCAVNAVTGTTNDFDTTPWITNSNNGGKEIPIFCCSGIDENSASASFTACTNTVSTGYYSVGCYDAFYAMIQKYSIYYIVIGVTILTIEALAVIFSCVVCKNANKTESV